ncbi:hypothetical protein K440DRAFT_672062 [Wilcoxina mikolae CBS 423.85]|nr:hypothetical protein K440DRAFT_672062 [Wilcoxina mikolae CBS 423.85]
MLNHSDNAILCTPGDCETPPPTPTTAFWHTQLPTIQNLIPAAIQRNAASRLLRLAAVSDTNLWLTQMLVTVFRIPIPSAVYTCGVPKDVAQVRKRFAFERSGTFLGDPTRLSWAADPVTVCIANNALATLRFFLDTFQGQGSNQPWASIERGSDNYKLQALCNNENCKDTRHRRAGRSYQLIYANLETYRPYTPLHIAAGYGRLEALEIVIQYFLYHQGDRDERYCLSCMKHRRFCTNCTTVPTSPIHCDSQGYIPIHFAVASTPSPGVSDADIKGIIRTLLHFGGPLPASATVFPTMLSPMNALVFYGYEGRSDAEKVLELLLAGSDPKEFWLSFDALPLEYRRYIFKEAAHLAKAWPNITRCRVVSEMLKAGELGKDISRLGPLQYLTYVATGFAKSISLQAVPSLEALECGCADLDEEINEGVIGLIDHWQKQRMEDRVIED